MTMQVGLVGTDGILLASDTRWMNSPRLRSNESWAGGRYTYDSHKIRISHERGIAIACARNMETASHVANEAIATLADEDFVYPIGPIEAIGARVLEAADKQRNEAHCLIAFAKPTPQLFLFQFATVNGQWGPFCQKMKTTSFAGDNVNPAIFWLERYYQPRPVEDLIAIAAHTIISAGKLNSGAIGGLEIVLCRHDGIRRLSEESISELHAQADQWDKSIGELVLGYRQQFSYAPDVAG